jgi:hypothetical protein
MRNFGHTIAEERDLLDWGSVTEEVEVHKCHILAASVLDHSLDASVANLAQSHVKSWGGASNVNRDGIEGGREGQEKRRSREETHLEAGRS